MQEYHLEDKHLQVSKYMMKKLLDHANNERNPGGDSYRSPKQNESLTTEIKPKNIHRIQGGGVGGGDVMGGWVWGWWVGVGGGGDGDGRVGVTKCLANNE